ncbi:MAG: hypothetical protein LBS92_06525 [Candidatus Methanoplasma sp.]|nr:hypothetical protein [Candidatus Methanoplasma sp.]
MTALPNKLIEMKNLLENAIIEDGKRGKESLIRSSKLINLLHEAVKEDLVSNGVDRRLIIPPVGQSSPEMKIAGFLKSKKQDICIVPKNVTRTPRNIDWGPSAVEEAMDEHGSEFTKHTLVINVRSQLSSICKNTDTLFERTFAEPLNLRLVYKDLIMGEVYLIPLYEYEEGVMDENRVMFKTRHTNVEKYISFFLEVSGRDGPEDALYMYEVCALLIVDFKHDPPKLYQTSKELVDDGIICRSFPLDLYDISYEKFIKTLLDKYDERFGVERLKD